MKLNISKNREDKKYPPIIQFKRVLWGGGRILFRVIPRPFYKPRRMLLRLFGAKVGSHVNISNTACIYFPWNLEIGDWSSIGDYVYVYNLGKITIGKESTISHKSHLCAGSHDYTVPDLPLLKPSIIVEDQAWICADSFVGPGVHISQGAVIGARSVVNKDVESWVVVAGNPAKYINKRKLSI
ncbi:hypothetical protein R7Z10_12090 [Vibrio sp. Vb1018]|uniref:hypothetical protein n=1 Tax=Vibrio sp. Vb1018 TaxID=3074636 RepID=UPI0029640284|nr:hypothetical protein [Vibrio sp. Vb1018]MDW1821124.1 hypothetical protein [Vibrio sp. Vb1018]